MDVDPHVLTSARVVNVAAVHVVDADTLPNAHWLYPGIPTAGQQAFGDDLLANHGVILVPSVVSRHSWNAVFEAPAGQDHLDDTQQEPFALDPRLHPPPEPA